MIIIAFVAGLLFMQAPEAQDWHAGFAAGKQAYAARDYATAAQELSAAAATAATTPDAGDGVVETLRLLATVHRDSGDYASAERVLVRAAEQCRATSSQGLLAAVLAETAATQRAQGRTDAALASIDEAVRIRESQGDTGPDLARDLTVAALLRLKSADHDKAVAALQRAVGAWDAASPGSALVLPAIEALATLYRDSTEYAEAKPLLVRALRLREAAGDPDSAEIISAVDSLAYVEFGLRNFAEAELQYRRLLALWQKHGGPDHPMTALTLDKMAEFYAFQQRYDEAADCASQALAARTRTYVGSLNQVGRLFIMQAKIPEPGDLYGRSVKIADLAKASDDTIDPILRIYARILREMKRNGEAEVLEARVKNAILKRAEKEGRRDPPGQKQ